MKNNRIEPEIAFLHTVLDACVVVIVTERVTAACGEWVGAGLLFVLLALVGLSGVAAVVSRKLGRPNWIVGAGICAGVFAGVLIDVSLDWFFFSNDRNLFPFEILVFWIIGLAPALAASLSWDKLDRILGLSTSVRPHDNDAG
jgi:hypothetical protein